MIDQFVANHGFKTIGSYSVDVSNVAQRSANVRITERKSLVYAIVSEMECKYIGKTVQGYSRPLNYHKNKVMKDVKSGIEQELQSGKGVTVYAKETDLHVEHEGFQINVIEGIEHALIKE
jgi:hypothetical protein